MTDKERILRNQLIVKLYLAGRSKEEIAAEVGVSKQTVRRACAVAKGVARTDYTRTHAASFTKDGYAYLLCGRVVKADATCIVKKGATCHHCILVLSQR